MPSSLFNSSAPKGESYLLSKWRYREIVFWSVFCRGNPILESTMYSSRDSNSPGIDQEPLDFGANVPTKKKAKQYVISSPYVHRLQRRHFFMFDVMPLLGTIFAVWYAFVVPITRLDLILFFAMWLVTGLSLSVGFHRHFCHRSFKAHQIVRVLFVAFGCMAARSSMITWACQHRRHHQLADHEGDVHSPNLAGSSMSGRFKGWLYSHVLWMYKHDYPNIVHYGSDLLKDRLILSVDRYYKVWIWVGLALPALIGGLLSHSWLGAVSGFLWGGVVRLFVVAQQISALNSFNHMFGSRPFSMSSNRSHNNALFGLMTWGEGWHNNHHAIASSANFGFRWYQIDPGFWLIRMLEITGLAWNVNYADREQVAKVMKQFAEENIVGAEQRGENMRSEKEPFYE